MRYKILIIFLLLNISFFAYGQNSVVFGIIRDIDTNKGIDFVTVYVEGTSNAIESDNNGQYSISVEENKKYH